MEDEQFLLLMSFQSLNRLREQVSIKLSTEKKEVRAKISSNILNSINLKSAKNHYLIYLKSMIKKIISLLSAKYFYHIISSSLYKVPMHIK